MYNQAWELRSNFICTLRYRGKFLKPKILAYSKQFLEKSEKKLQKLLKNEIF